VWPREQAERKARIKEEKKALKEDDKQKLENLSDDDLAELGLSLGEAVADGAGPEVQAQLNRVTREWQRREREGLTAITDEDDLLTVLRRVKLPTRDDSGRGLQGELDSLRNEQVNFGTRQQLFDSKQGSLDRTAERLRGEGFNQIQTPDDVIEFTKRALVGERILPQPVVDFARKQSTGEAHPPASDDRLPHDNSASDTPDPFTAHGTFITGSRVTTAQALRIAGRGRAARLYFTESDAGRKTAVGEAEFRRVAQVLPLARGASSLLNTQTGRSLPEIGRGQEAFVYEDAEQGVVYKVYTKGHSADESIGMRVAIDEGMAGLDTGTPRDVIEKAWVINDLGGTPTEIVGFTQDGEIVVKQPRGNDAAQYERAQVIAKAHLQEVPADILPRIDMRSPLYYSHIAGQDVLLGDLHGKNFIGDTIGRGRINDLATHVLTTEELNKLPKLNAWINERRSAAHAQGSADFARAWHGSPYRGIEKEGFRLQNIGSGEGAQAYGWGIYFAGDRKVSEGYRKNLTNELSYYENVYKGVVLSDARLDNLAKNGTKSERVVFKDPEFISPSGNLVATLKKQLESKKRSLAQAEKFSSKLRKKVESTRKQREKAPTQFPELTESERQLANWEHIEAEARAQIEAIPEVLASLESKEMTVGQLYSADIPEAHELLDWDKPLSEQPAKVQEAVSKILDSLPPEMQWMANGFTKETRGQDLYGSIADIAIELEHLENWRNPVSDGHDSERAGSELLLKHGVPGLRYLDGNSRGQGEGSHNYVIWDESRLNKDIQTYYARQRQLQADAKTLRGKTEQSPLVADDFTRRIERIAPALMLRYQALVGDYDSLFSPEVGVRPWQVDGKEQAAHIINGRKRILWFLQQNLRADKNGLMDERLRRDMLHEASHAWLGTLETDRKEFLFREWQRDIKAADGWLAQMKREGVELREGVATDWAEYWAERLAYENSKWAGKRERWGIAGDRGLLAQLYAEFRQFLADAIDLLQRAFTRTKRYNIDFRQFLTDPRYDAKQAEGRSGIENRSNDRAAPNERGLSPLVAAKAWHGSPHRGIEKEGFKLNKIGTGEGMQAYGWGIYFADKREVSEWYKQRLEYDAAYNSTHPLLREMEVSGLYRANKYHVDELLEKGEVEVLGERGGTVKLQELSEPLKEFLREYNAVSDTLGPQSFNDPHSFLSQLTRRREFLADYPQVSERLKEMHKEHGPKEGQLYSADIPDTHELLDWGKPLREHPAQVRAAAEQAVKQAESLPLIDGSLPTANRQPLSPDVTGYDIYKRISDAYEVRIPHEGKHPESQFANSGSAQKAASELLAAHGIPGLRYLDGNSIGPDLGTYNYVIWDESRLNNDIQIYYARKAAQTREDIQRVIDAAKQPSGHAPQKADLGPVADWVAQAVKDKLGVDVSDYRHILDGSAVRHIITNHYNARAEARRGNIALTDADLLALSQLLETADKVIFGTKNNLHKDQIVYLKHMPDGSTLYLEEIRSGRGELAAVSARKYPATIRAESILSTLNPHVQDDSGNALTVVERPAEVKSDKVTADFARKADDGPKTLSDEQRLARNLHELEELNLAIDELKDVQTRQQKAEHRKLLGERNEKRMFIDEEFAGWRKLHPQLADGQVLDAKATRKRILEKQLRKAEEKAATGNTFAEKRAEALRRTLQREYPARVDGSSETRTRPPYVRNDSGNAAPVVAEGRQVNNSDSQRALARAELVSMPPVSVSGLDPTLTGKPLREAAYEAYKEAAKDGPVQMRDGRLVELTTVGFKKVRSHSADRKLLDLFTSIREVLEKAVPIASLPHVPVDRTDSIRAWHYYGAKVAFGEQELYAKLVVRESVNGEIYYDTNFSRLEEAVARDGDAIPDKPEAAPRLSDDMHTLGELLDGVKAAEPATPSINEGRDHSVVPPLLGHTNIPPKPGQTVWQWLVDFIKGFRNFVPEISPRDQDYAPLRQFYKAIKRATPQNQARVQEILGRIVKPLLDAGMGPKGADLYRKLGLTQQRIRKLEKEGAGKPDVQAKHAAELARLHAQVVQLNAQLEAQPYHLFNKLVLAEDYVWRAENLKDEKTGQPLALPDGITLDQAKAEVARLTALVEAHPHVAAINRAYQSHLELVAETWAELERRFPELKTVPQNPYYFPHHIINDKHPAKLARVRLDTAAELRKYLIEPTGSILPIETDYAKAMSLHLSAVYAHNSRADLVRDLIKNQFDKLPELRERAKELSEERGERVGWQDVFNEEYKHSGYVKWTPDDRLHLHSEAIVSREKLAKRLGVALGDGDLQTELAKAGITQVQLLPSDIREALVPNEKETWIIPEKVAQALEAMIDRESRYEGSDLGSGLARSLEAAQNLWKKHILFSPWNYIRYEYNNTTSDLEKLFSADPAVFGYLPSSLREVMDLFAENPDRPPTVEARIAKALGVMQSVTIREAGDLPQLKQFAALKARPERLRDIAKAASTLFLANGRSTIELSQLREATFRYAKFKADLDRMRNGARPVYAGAYHKDIEAIILTEDQANTIRAIEGNAAEGRTPTNAVNYLKAAEISLATFGDYDTISVSGQALRKMMIPFYSWIEINFRYHANLFRNLRDMAMAGEMSQADARKAGTRAAGVLAATFTRKVAALTAGRLLLPYLAVAMWNNSGDNEEIEDELSEADRRRFHINLGRDKDGRARVVYAATALGDVMKWFGGDDLFRLGADLMKGRTTLAKAVEHYSTQFLPDLVNNLAGGIGPVTKVIYTLASHKSTFPDITDQRTIPAYDLKWNILSQMTDGFTADMIRRVLDKDYLAPRDLGDWAQQLILQVRKRDAASWSFYAIKDKAADWNEKRTGKSRGQSDYNSPEMQVLRNYRRAIYRGDVKNAMRFYDRLLEFGYTAERIGDRSCLFEAQQFPHYRSQSRSRTALDMWARPKAGNEVALRYRASFG